MNLKERSFGREPDLLRQAQMTDARDASTWVESRLGKDSDLTSTEKEDLQIMLDFFPPYLESLVHSQVCSRYDPNS